MLTQISFGTLKDGTAAHLYSLQNKSGDKVSITDFGATIVSLQIPGRHDVPADIVLGYDKVGDYEDASAYLGSTIGRYANRIAGGRFNIDGMNYLLSRNEGSHHLHGGFQGFSKYMWDVDPITEGAAARSLTLRRTSLDQEEGYPGNLNVSVTFTLDDNRELAIGYEARTDKDTVINLTNHMYFNLKGSGNVEGHFLTLNSSRFTPVNSEMIPTGELLSVANTPFDFREHTGIRANINLSHIQLRLGGGFDHNWVLDRNDKELLFHAATLSEPDTGRNLQVWTTEPGIQFYSGNRLDATILGKKDKSYGARSGLCLETQHFPDSPNHPNFPSTVLRVQDSYRSTTIYKFGAS